MILQCLQHWKCLGRAGVPSSEIDIVVDVTSSGLALPGLSAIIAKQLSLKPNAKRNDIVGMGCSAGMTGLQTLHMMCKELCRTLRQRVTGLLVCCEINSAIYVNDDSPGKGVVNSLFGDGAGSLLVQADPLGFSSIQKECKEDHMFPKIALMDFETLTLTQHFDEMVYQVDPASQQLHFKLSKSIPFIVGEKAPKAVQEFLKKNNLIPADISHWFVHAGGQKVMEGFAEGLSLSLSKDLRHTVSVLRDYGNLSSASFIVSFQRFVQEVAKGNEVDRVNV